MCRLYPGAFTMCVLSDDNGLHISDMPPELLLRIGSPWEEWLSLHSKLSKMSKYH